MACAKYIIQVLSTLTKLVGKLDCLWWAFPEVLFATINGEEASSAYQCQWIPKWLPVEGVECHKDITGGIKRFLIKCAASCSLSCDFIIVLGQDNECFSTRTSEAILFRFVIPPNTEKRVKNCKWKCRDVSCTDLLD